MNSELLFSNIFILFVILSVFIILNIRINILIKKIRKELSIIYGELFGGIWE